jgi:PDZ domain-containing protein
MEASPYARTTSGKSVSADDTTSSTVAAGDAESQRTPAASTVHEPGPRGARALWVALGVCVTLLVGGVLFVFIAPARWVGIDDYIVAPGNATASAPAISVSGTEEFEPEGEIAFTTVRVKRDATIWDWWRARHDSRMELAPPEEIDGDRTRDETRAVSQFQMNQSQDTAALVALRFMGYEVVPEVEGAFVVSIVDGSPADEALELGDLVVEVDDREIRSAGDLSDVIGSKSPGDGVELVLLRSSTQGSSGAAADAVEIKAEVVLAEHRDREGVGFLGVAIETPVRADAPFDVEIDVGRVRGPSAGLAFSLAILDVLTEGELTGGARVATTGTIDRAGMVGPVGGVPQKVEAAISAGIEAFLVPPFEFVEAARTAGDRIEVRCVQTFDDAVITLGDYGGNGLDVAADLGAPTPERSPSVIDADDGYFSCAEAEVELTGTDGLAASGP